MAIEYLEIRNAERSIIGIIDTAQSVIWHEKYKGVGDFEIYAKATPEHLNLLEENNYITRLDKDEIGIIENIAISYSVQNGRMITATGRFAKSILDRRHIYNPRPRKNQSSVVIPGYNNDPTIIGRQSTDTQKVEKAVRYLVNNNAINCTFNTDRNFSMLELGALSNLPEIITDENGNAAEIQVSYDNLLTYTDELLTEYNLSSKVIINKDTLKLQYVVYKGTDRSTSNTEGNEPIIFSQEFDNLIESEYTLSTTQEKNVALIGGEGEGVERFYALIGGTADLTRRETFIDASSINKKYKDDQEVEHEYTDTQYDNLLKSSGKNTLAPLKQIESFNGKLDVSNGQFQLNVNFALGDVVTIQDNEIGKYINARIIETTEVQDEDGYTVEIEYE